MTAPDVRMVCPKCHSAALRSDEKATIGYPVVISRNAHGQITPEYTGAHYAVFDEGTVYDGEDLWCRDCGHNFTEADLIPEPDDDQEP